MKFKAAILAVVFSYTVCTGALAADFTAEGEMQTAVSNPVYNINPWNTLSVKGVGESGQLDIYTENGIVRLPLDYPLYRINDYYCDKIVCRGGVWGIERNVAVKTFDGSENWEIFKKQSFQNKNTVIFRCDRDFEMKIRNGVCTHFDVHTYESQRDNIYDGISLDGDGSGVLMRFMNVRNIKTADELKAYLKGRYDAGAAVKLYYPAVEAVFTPFDEEYQRVLTKTAEEESLGYSDFIFNGFKYEKKYAPNEKFFDFSSTGNEEMNIFLSCVENAEIFGGGSEKYCISGVRAYENGFDLYINSSDGEKYTANVLYENYDFITEKPSEIKFEGDGNAVIKLSVNLRGVKAFSENAEINCPINDVCKKTVHPVIQPVVYASEGTSLDFNNCLLYANESGKDVIEIYSQDGKQLSENGIYVSDGNSLRAYATVNGQKMTYFDIKCAHKKAENKSIMFLGDSIINQNYYTQYFVSLYDSVKTVGTLGKDGAQHEGRGGWSAYIYCRENSKYGYSNPFINNGKFDFGFYMEKQKAEKIDAVVINLGINDLNTAGHNRDEEILGYFDEMVNSIHSFDNDIKIVINAPERLFADEKTNTAANARLLFASELFKHYENAENVTVVSAYLNLKGKDDFKYVEPKLSEDSPSGAMTVKDTTHPNISGYKNLAKGTYDAINYIFK